mgnify:CR=1 FL=1
MTPKILNAALLAALLAAAPAFALESDRSRPIEIEADQGSLDQANQVTTFSGNVVSASGSPVRFGQTLDGNKGTVNGQANQVEYSSATGIVKLTGNARVQRGGDLAEGASIVYNTRTEVYTVSGSKAAGGKGGKRVTVVIQPTK